MIRDLTIIGGLCVAFALIALAPYVLMLATVAGRISSV